MNTLTRIAIAIALGLCCAAFHASNSQTKPTKKFPTGSISGRVTLKSKGKSGIIVRARVMEFGNQPGTMLKAATDAEGNYRINEMPAGSYQVMPLAPNYVVPDLKEFGRGRAVILAEGENVEDIDFSMTRGAVITGKVTYADGRPVVDERVTLTNQGNQSTSQMYSAPFFNTDDRGIYRIYGLAPGQYKLSVGQVTDGSFAPANRGRAAYQRVFYPNATNADEAKVIELTEGSEATNIDITVDQSVQTFAVTGQIVDGETGKPLSNIRLALQRVASEQRFSAFASGASNAQGEFRMEGVTPGKYSALIIPQPNHEALAEPVPFEVADRDVAGIIVRTSKGAVLSGTVVIEGTSDKTARAKLSQLRLHVYVHSEEFTSWGQSSLLGMDGSFRVGGLGTGSATFQLSNVDHSSVKGFFITRVEREGVVQPRRDLEIKAGEQISGLKVVLLYGSGTVRGTVKYVNGEPAPGSRSTVHLASSGGGADLRPTDVDARGHFVIEGVPAGSYDVVAQVVYSGEPRSQTSSAREAVTVTENAVTEVTLSIDVNKRSNP